MDWLFLAVSCVGALFTLNAFFPVRHPWWLGFPSFLTGWFTIELALHHVAWQMLAAAWFVWAGAANHLPGLFAFGVCALSWLGLLASAVQSNRTRAVLDAALDAELGTSPVESASPWPGQQLQAPIGIRRLFAPFAFEHPGVERIADVAYADEGGMRNLLDIYRPKAGVENAPVLFQIHGGGWVVGHKRQQALPLLVDLASRGFVCVSANYRLSPHAKFPEHLLDVKRALIWIREHIREYGGDPDCVIVTGGSAGGHLASLVALTPNLPEYQPGHENVDTSVQGCIPLYGLYDLDGAVGSQVPAGILQLWETRIMKHKRADNPAAFRQASPIAHIHADAPPFFVIHGTHDTMIPAHAGRRFAAALREVSRNKVVYAELPFAQHSFDGFHSMRTHHVIRGIHRFLAFVLAERHNKSPARAA